MKFSPDGKLFWSTLLGGPNYDRAYAIEVDRKGNVYVAGRAGPGFPVSEGAFQTEYGGTRYNGFYGSQNGFVAKLAPDGDKLIWASYVGVGELCRDLAIDEDGDIYLPLAWNTRSGSVPAPNWLSRGLADAFQREPAGDLDCGIVKVASDGSAVRWATWLGGSGKDIQAASIRVDAKKRVAIVLNTQSTDFPTTPDAFQPAHGGDRDAFVVLLSADFSRLIYSTYMGGTAFDTGRSACFGPQGELCVTGAANGPGWPARNAFQAAFAGTNDGRWGNGDCIVAQFRRTTH
jgi:hypothetical protein